MAIEQRVVPITRPCPVDLDALSEHAGAKRWFCGHCDKHVHALSNMTEPEVRTLFAAHVGEQLCVSYSVRDDGTLFTQPEPAVVPAQALRRPRRALAAAAAATLSLAACTTAAAPIEDAQEVPCGIEADLEEDGAPGPPSSTRLAPKVVDEAPNARRPSLLEAMTRTYVRGEAPPVELLPDRHGDPEADAPCDGAPAVEGGPAVDRSPPTGGAPGGGGRPVVDGSLARGDAPLPSADALAPTRPTTSDAPKRGKIKVTPAIPGGITVPQMPPAPPPPSNLGGASIADPRDDGS